MIFAAPAVLLALAALPLLWWLLRVTPPAPRRQIFPAIRLLAGLDPVEQEAARTPWWLLALRMLAAALVIIGLARPVFDARPALPGSGPMLLVIDDGWASAASWPRVLAAGDAALDRLARTGRPAALLGTARTDDGMAPSPSAVMPPAELRARLAVLRPKPWPVDRAAAAAALRAWKAGPGRVATGTGAAVYLGDGIDAPGAAEFAAALGAIGAVTEVRPDGADLGAERLLLAPREAGGALVAVVARVPVAGFSPPARVLAQSSDGRSLAEAVIEFPPGAASAAAPLALPPELRNELGQLVLAGTASAGAHWLLDERWRRRPVGLLAGDAIGAGTPLLGELYYLRRALTPYAELREGSLETLLARPLAVLVLADRVIPDGGEAERLERWVEQGGTLIRFAGPRLAEHPDGLLPVGLLAGDRALGGALSWSKPAHLAPFPAGSPFAGLAVPEEVSVTRQVLAEPRPDLARHAWAGLTDGTPLVTAATRGAGRIVLFHVSANADWSNLALSGLFVDMLRRLVALSAGIAAESESGPQPPALTLDGFGALGPPPVAALPLAGEAFGRTEVSPRHPPGLYGPEASRRALNLGAALGPLTASAPIAGAAEEPLGAAAPERALGPWLIAAALALFILDLLVSLGLRGVLRRGAVAAALALLLVLPPAPPGPHAAERYPSLAIHLAYVVTGDDGVDQISRAGLLGLSDYVNQRTAAVLAEPVAVAPGRDDLSLYPLLYWPILAEAPLPPADALAALNDYMAHGGIILIDTRGGAGGSGEDFNPGVDAVLAGLGKALSVPPLAPLTTEHVLARAFYLLRDFPGRYVGAPVWVQRQQDRANDSVSPVIIGANDWASAWAVDAEGHNPYAVIPGGAHQRLLAYRFGVNLVMYALTGNYKGDQVHVPAILERLGQ